MPEDHVKRILFIYPPWTRNSAPPVGLSLIQGIIAEHQSRTGVVSRILDLNAIAAHRIPQIVTEDGSHKTHRSILRRNCILKYLTGASGYQSIDHYQTNMQYYKMLLTAYGRQYPIILTPGDFIDKSFNIDNPNDVSCMLDSENHPLLNPLKSDLETRIKDFCPDCIGISIIYKSQLSPALALVKYLKSHYPDIHLSMGGALLSCLPMQSLKTIKETHVSMYPGSAEEFLKEKLNITLDASTSFPAPEYSGIDFHLYFAPFRTLQMITSRGCYWANCSFCDECNETFKSDSSDHVIDTMDILARRYQARHIHFTDHAIPPSTLTKISASNMIASWSGFVRVSPKLADDSYVLSLKQSGCRMLQIGMETPDQSLLDNMNKGIKADLFPAIIKTLRNHDIRSYIYMLFGYPGQSIRSCESTLAFLEQTKPDFVNASIFRWYPNAPLSKLQSHIPGIGNSNTPANDDPGSCGISIPELRRWMSNRLQNSTIIRSIIKNTPHYYKSSHAVYF